MTLDDALRSLVQVGGSDLHIKVGAPLMLRHKGDLLPSDIPPLSTSEVQEMLYAVLTENQRHRLETERELDFSRDLENVARFRGNIFFQRGVPGAVFRAIPTVIPSLDCLTMPKVIKEFADSEQGLILVTGPTGSGKSTTLAAVVNEINENHYKHILTIEDPIEFVHHDKNCTINQREVGSDTLSFAEALRRGLRQDPDVILVGEMRDQETIRIAITAAETGHLVLSTLHTNDAKQSIDRVINSFPPEEHHQLRMKLSLCLLAVISQRLIKRIDGQGRVVAQEIMINSPTIKKLIESGRIGAIDKAIEESSTYYNMQSMNQCLFALWREKLIDENEALAVSNNPNDLRLKLKTAAHAKKIQVPAEACKDIK
ncbi:MAG: type IV pilus twitching motility protein PilT [Candidatus Eremiobacteraeota bacterium]|nr:type IV pilus twitching motility protein PilT [Candidatus Eremiobacteraeota bacterium]